MFNLQSQPNSIFEFYIEFFYLTYIISYYLILKSFKLKIFFIYKKGSFTIQLFVIEKKVFILFIPKYSLILCNTKHSPPIQIINFFLQIKTLIHFIQINSKIFKSSKHFYSQSKS